ncbi:DUF4951 domain-containing protein [Acinetobacter qingfengensis]|nr:DUF4951 domain-containing protein [Acinetobacter qingfengensis]
MKKYRNFKSICLMITAIFLMSCQQTEQVKISGSVNPEIARKAIPATPNNMSLPEFGKEVIQWGSGPQQAKQRYETVNIDDIAVMKNKGLTLEMAKSWQAFYENENKRNPENQAAVYRAKLMKKIVNLW